jgi:putative oxidoreductase
MLSSSGTTASGPVFRVLNTPNDPMLTLVRLVLGGIMFAHATQKMFGWFGGNGFGPAIEFYNGVLGIPVAIAVFAILTEFLSSLGLISGFLSRAAAVGIISIMVGAIGIMIGPNGFFMNWFGQMEAGREGYEYHLLVIAMAVVLVARGGGALSVDRVLTRNAGEAS